MKRRDFWCCCLALGAVLSGCDSSSNIPSRLPNNARLAAVLPSSTELEPTADLASSVVDPRTPVPRSSSAFVWMRLWNERRMGAREYRLGHAGYSDLTLLLIESDTASEAERLWKERTPVTLIRSANTESMSGLQIRKRLSEWRYPTPAGESSGSWLSVCLTGTRDRCGAAYSWIRICHWNLLVSEASFAYASLDPVAFMNASLVSERTVARRLHC